MPDPPCLFGIGGIGRGGRGAGRCSSSTPELGFTSRGASSQQQLQQSRAASSRRHHRPPAAAAAPRQQPHQHTVTRIAALEVAAGSHKELRAYLPTEQLQPSDPCVSGGSCGASGSGTRRRLVDLGIVVQTLSALPKAVAEGTECRSGLVMACGAEAVSGADVDDAK